MSFGLRSLRILFVSAEYPPETGGGGIGSYVASIAPALVKLGHEVHVLSCVPGQENRDYFDNGVHIHRRKRIWIRGLGLVSRWLNLTGIHARLLLGLSTFIEHRRLGIMFDVLEYPDWHAEGWCFAAFRNRPLVAYLQTPLPLVLRYNGLRQGPDHKLSSALEKMACRRADLVTSVSQLLLQELEKINWLDGRKVEVIPYPIDWPKWSQAKPVSKTAPIALFVGRMETRKAPELLVKAIKLVRRLVPEAEALLVGKNSGQRDGLSYLEWMKSSTADIAGCRFVDQVPREALVDILSQCRVLVLPSQFEALGMVALEAMAAGRPVIVTTACGLAQLVLEAKAGMIIPPDDANALAEALVPLLKDAGYAERIGDCARSTVRAQLSPERIAEQREKVYRRAIANFKHRLEQKTGGFPHAIPSQIGSLGVPQAWNKWAVGEAAEVPWKHFYLQTARQLLELLIQHPSFTTRSDLLGVRVLDVGCTPAVTVLLASLGADVYLLDINANEVLKGLNYAQLLAVEKRLHVVVGDGFRLPFRTGTFHLVWNSGFLEHFEDPELIIHEMKRVMLRDAAFLTLVPNRWTPHSLWVREQLRRQPHGYYWDLMGRERSYSRRELVRLLESCGLEVIGSATGNLRRSLLDDSVLLPRFARIPLRGLLFDLINASDWLETRVRFFTRFGFMTGAIALDPCNCSDRLA
jgi:glycogen(starch) synthase